MWDGRGLICILVRWEFRIHEQYSVESNFRSVKGIRKESRIRDVFYFVVEGSVVKLSSGLR